MLERILAYAQTLGAIPQAPYLHRASLRQVLQFLAELNIRPQGLGNPAEGTYASDAYALYVNFRRGQPRVPVLFDSHLDHPALVLDGRGGGVALGSLGLDRIKRLTEVAPIPLRIFHPEGHFLTKGKLVALHLAGKPYVQVETPSPIPANCHALWDVTDFTVEGDHLLMHSADNTIVTAVMLALLEQVARNPTTYRDLDVTFVFTFLEEIFEVSATAIAQRRRTPFGPIDERSLIVVLESMETIPLAYQEQRETATELIARDLRAMRQTDERWVLALRDGAALDRDAVHPLYRTFDLPLPQPDGGVMLKVNDIDCVYGYEFPATPNLAESLLLRLSDELQIVPQHTLAGGACNGTAYSLFPTTSHIVTLSVPNPCKHNMDLAGQIVPERVRLDNIAAAGRLGEGVLHASATGIAGAHPHALAQRLKATALRPNAASARRLQIERGTIAWGAYLRLQHMRYFGASLPEQFAFGLRGSSARLRERVQHLVG
ncbi:MAG: hypothetical protein WCP31_07405 [Chloroflexales bacterium]